jgi:hypothetical protein
MLRNPNKYTKVRILTLLWLDLVDPSTTNNFFKGNLREKASFSIFSLSSPSGSYLS